MFANKHVAVAMLVAPVLSILAWFAVDYLLSERPHAARPGASYRLVAKSNCRYASGECDLENGDFELHVQAAEIAATTVTLRLRSRFALQQATIGLINSESRSAPAQMTSIDAGGTRWTATLALPDDDASTLGIAVNSKGATYFAEIPITFMQRQR
jgi:hypothetical protein